MRAVLVALDQQGFRFPQAIIAHAVSLYHRFNFSVRAVEDLLAARGVLVTYETVRRWSDAAWAQFGQQFANQWGRRRAQPGDTWHADDVSLKINGKTHYVWRAADQHGTVLDILVQSRRNKAAAGALWAQVFRKLLEGCTYVPRVPITDKLGSYGTAHKEVTPVVATAFIQFKICPDVIGSHNKSDRNIRYVSSEGTDPINTWSDIG